MRPIIFLLIALISTQTHAQSQIEPICIFAGNPPDSVEYEVLRPIKLAKNTYGSPNSLLPKFARIARGYGADAIINMTKHQRFGFWPWKVIRPIVRGKAAIIINKESFNCVESGGMPQ